MGLVKETSISTSLSGRDEPVATEPKSRARFTPYFFIIGATVFCTSVAVIVVRESYQDNNISMAISRLSPIEISRVCGFLGFATAIQYLKFPLPFLFCHSVVSMAFSTFKVAQVSRLGAFSVRAATNEERCSLLQEPHIFSFGFSSRHLISLLLP